MRRKKRKPEVSAGIFLVAAGAVCLGIAAFSPMSPGRRFSGTGIGLMALSWGLKEIAAAKRWKQEPEEEHYAKTPEEQRESEQYEKLEKSGSLLNVATLVVGILVCIAVIAVLVLAYFSFFHHRP